MEMYVEFKGLSTSQKLEDSIINAIASLNVNTIQVFNSHKYCNSHSKFPYDYKSNIRYGYSLEWMTA